MHVNRNRKLRRDKIGPGHLVTTKSVQVKSTKTKTLTKNFARRKINKSWSSALIKKIHLGQVRGLVFIHNQNFCAAVTFIYELLRRIY